MLARLVAPLLLLLMIAAPAKAAPVVEAPPLDALVGRISMSLGGPTGARKSVDGAAGIELVFRRTVRESHSSTELTADHRYVEHGDRVRVDVRIIDGEGKDSAAIADGEAGWLVVDGAVHEVDAAAIRGQVSEFDPRRLWSVPFALAAEGREILQAASLEVEGKVSDEAGDRFVMVGRDGEGEETSRLEVDAKTYRPTRVQFLSSSGKVEYRYEDYREIAPGLIVPFVREFYRNGTRLSRTEVALCRLGTVPDEAALFDRSGTSLPALTLPKGFGAGR